MSRRQRLAVFVLMTVLWLSGCVWLYVDQMTRQQDPFGGERSAWVSSLLSAHGIIAVAGMYLFGWITAHHIALWWSMERRRVSGGLLSGMLVILIISGFALFFLSDDRWQHYAAVVHDVLGVAAAAFAAQHWFMFRRLRRSSQATKAA